jgi:hypothetical protein
MVQLPTLTILSISLSAEHTDFFQLLPNLRSLSPNGGLSDVAFDADRIMAFAYWIDRAASLWRRRHASAIYVGSFRRMSSAAPPAVRPVADVGIGSGFSPLSLVGSDHALAPAPEAALFRKTIAVV